MCNMFKGAISGHIQFLATGSSLKIMKNAFYFTLKYLGINNSRFYTVCFHCMPSSRLSKYVKTKLQITSFTSYKAFLKKQKGICN